MKFASVSAAGLAQVREYPRGRARRLRPGIDDARVAPESAAPTPMATITPPDNVMSVGCPAGTPLDECHGPGVVIVVPARCEKIEAAYADAHAIADLFDDDRLRRAGSLGTNLEAAVHGTRAHDDRVGTEAVKRPCEAIFGVVRTRGGKNPPPALDIRSLDTQHQHDRVRLSPFVSCNEVPVPGLDAQQQRRGAHESDTRA